MSGCGPTSPLPWRLLHTRGPPASLSMVLLLSKPPAPPSFGRTVIGELMPAGSRHLSPRLSPATTRRGTQPVVGRWRLPRSPSGSLPPSFFVVKPGSGKLLVGVGGEGKSLVCWVWRGSLGNVQNDGFECEANHHKKNLTRPKVTNAENKKAKDFQQNRLDPKGSPRSCFTSQPARLRGKPLG